MAKINALNILLEPQGKDYLKELYAKVIQNVERETISSKLKNRDLSGDPEAGTVVCKRFANSRSKRYGSARTSGTGDQIKALDVTIPIDIDREIVEELEHKDVKLYGVDGVLNRRSVDHVRTMATDLDFAFFEQGALEATPWQPKETHKTLNTLLEEMLVMAENTRNEYVRGIPRNMLHLVLSADVYSAIRNDIDTGIGRTDVALSSEQFGDFNGAYVHKCLTMPVGVKVLLMIEGALAQPVMANEYKAEKINLSNAYAVELFYSYGTKVATPDLIWVWYDTVVDLVATPDATDEFDTSLAVELVSKTPDIKILYTIDGSNVDKNDVYDAEENADGKTLIYNSTTGITVTKTMTIKAVGYKDNYFDSKQLEVTYTKSAA